MSEPNKRPPKQRKKASSACVSCRARRTKCNVEPGHTVCSYCERNNLQCIFQDDDERKNSASKAHIRALDGRVQMLEGLLKAAGQPPSSLPATNSSQEHNGNSSEDNPQASNTSPRVEQPVAVEACFQDSEPVSQPHAIHDSPHSSHVSLASHAPVFSTGQSTHSSPYSLASTNTVRPVVAHLVATAGNLGAAVGPGDDHDRASTAAAILLSETREQRRQTDRLLEDVPRETDDYLVSLFFEFGNSTLRIVDQEAFMHDKARGGSTSYSGFLHVVLLAMGLRFADHSRPDVARYLLPSRESTLLRGARYLVEYELQGHGGIPSIQALLLLGDLEAACGRDKSGWMYGGLAIRMCFDMELNYPPKTDLPRWESRNRRAALWGCYLHDRYWSFYLGRPTSMKRTDIVASKLKLEGQSPEEQIVSALITLMDLSTSITDNVEDTSKTPDDASYVYMTGLHRKLHTWYSELPPALHWNTTNIKNAPVSFFLLHQQYYSSLILLHRPLAQPNNASLHEDKTMYELALVSRTICFHNAMKIAQSFAYLRERFDVRKIYFSAVQHAGTAATALINGLSSIEDPSDRVNPLQHCQTLFNALRDMGSVYQPAHRMSIVLGQCFVVARWNSKDCPAVSKQGPKPKEGSFSESNPRKRSTPIEDAAVSDSPSKRPCARTDEVSSSYQLQTEIPFPQFFELNMDEGHFQSHLDMSHDQLMGEENGSTVMDIVLPSDFRDGNWDATTQLSPTIPRRANFLDMSSGFDQLFQSAGSGVL